MSRKQNYLELIKTILVTNLLNAPEHIKKKLPSILSKPSGLIFSFTTKDYLIVSLIDSKERERIDDLRKKNIHPFPFLIRPVKSDAFVFFNLPNGTKNVQIGKLTLEGGFGFSLGRNCTFVVNEVRQSAELENIGKYEYVIDLAYVVSFGEEITKNNSPKYIDELIVYSLKNWGVN